jgi:ribulose-phosphate 3-epimerase
MDQVEQVADGFHIDVMDGHFVPELLFGPDFVRAVRGRTRLLVDVHLMVEDADPWLASFVSAGATMITVHAESCAMVADTLAAIEALGARPGIAVGSDAPLGPVFALLDRVDRVLLMGTRLGVKGADIVPQIYERIHAVVRERDRSVRRPEVFVDGGIRRHTVPLLAQAGADGVIPGSLVFGRPDPAAAVHWIAGLSRTPCQGSSSSCAAMYGSECQPRVRTGIQGAWRSGCCLLPWALTDW